MNIAAATRVFLFNGKRLADINPTLPPERVKAAYAGTYPELASAVVRGPEAKDGVVEYTFVAQIGAKG